MHAASSAKYMGFRNRLGLEKSPYLLQHANNPVDWYPWGSEAFTKARDENKIIFLSVGYSTCHWCHVMERESFESEEVGRLLNENFVSIKVDREERPDIDHIYMTFVQATSGGGGWPMSVWLTPDLVPIVGGTYFPPDDRYFNRPGFKTILNRIARAWRESEADVKAQGQAILNALRRAASQQELSRSSTLPDFNSAVSKCLATLVSSYDSKLGGFGHAPKFPQPVKLNFLLHVYDFCRRGMLLDKERGQRALDMTLHTLRMMARGGMHDHVGKGFHRYSTDEDWHIPHFEKMLYDQAQLAVIYADAYQITKDELFADVAKDILSYVGDNLSDKTGGFYSAEDADSLPTADAAEKREGAFCVWTYSEVQDLLNTDIDGSNVKLADVICYHFDVQTSGNVDVYKDPHGELTHKNVFIERGDIMQTAHHFHLTVEQTRQALNKGKEQLLTHRKLRPPPHLDNKMITAWNGMMISAFAKAGQVFNSDSFVKRAVDAIQFVKSYLYVGADGTDSSSTSGRLLRSCYIDCDTKAVTQSSAVVNGFADDYAFMVRAALDVYEACHDDAWLEWAVELQKTQDELFWDAENAGYFITTSDDASVILRMKEEQDGAEPSYNSVSARNLLRLSAMLDEQAYRKKAEALFSSFSQQLEKLPVATPELLSALMIHGVPSQQVCVCGTPSSDDTALMLQCIHSYYLPRKTLLVIDRNSEATASSFLVSKRKSLSAFDKVDGRATVYVCDNFTCSLPVSDVDELEKLLSNFP